MSLHFKPAAILAAALLLGAASGAAAAEAKGKASIEGVWKVTHVEFTGADPATVNHPMENLTIFSRGHYASVGNQSEKARNAAPAYKTPGKPTDAEKLAKFDEWAPIGAQAGTYELKGGKLTRTPIVAKNVGAVTAGAFTSDVKTLTADKLVLATPAPAGQPAREQTVTYARVK